MAVGLGGGKYAGLRARNIARTESGNALNGARKAGMDKMMAELGPQMQGVMRPTWLSVLGSTTRDTHANLDGVPADKDGMWTLAGYRIPWPAHVSLPASERCNCFPAGVLVSGDFTGAYRVWYDGIIAEIVTVAGTRLSVTPNHPVMTLDGFVPACQLKPGQKIVAHRLQVDDGIQLTAGEILGHSQVGVCDKVQNKPVPVEQVFEAFRATSVPVEVKPAEMNDFYGDGQFMPGDIEIVRPDWELLSNGVSSTLEKHGDFVFALVDRELQLIFGLGSGNSSGDGITVSPPSSPCLAEPLLCVPIGRITPSGSLAVGVASDFNPPLLKTSRKNRPGIAAFLRDSLKGDSGLVFLDEVVEIRYFEASHWVYDLQSVRGVIVAGNALYTDNALPKIGIVTSNCQCSIVMSFGLQDPEAEQMIDQYNQRVEEYEQGLAEQEEAKSVKHLPGQHNQMTHGRGGGGVEGDTGGRKVSEMEELNYDDKTSEQIHGELEGWEDPPDSEERTYGGILFDDEGKTLLREPSGHYGGYEWTLAKGSMDSPDEHPSKVAKREVMEETGQDGAIIGHVPQKIRRKDMPEWGYYYFIMRSRGEHPGQMDSETASTKWVTKDEAIKMLSRTKDKYGRQRDIYALEKAYEQLEKMRKGTA